MKLSPFKVFFVVSLLAGFSAAAPMETSETVSEVIPAPESSPVVSLPPVTGTGEEKEEEEEGGEMHILPIDEEQEEESDTVHILPLEPIVPIEEPTTEDTTDGTVSILPLDPIVPMLILDSTEAIADCRAKVVAEFKRPFNLLLRQITANLTGFNGPRTFFKADKYSYFILQSEVAIVKSNLPPYIDYEAYDLQTGELVTMRTREKYEADGSDIKDEVVCNGVMGSLVHDYFKSHNIYGTKWMVIRAFHDLPTSHSVLEQGRENAPEHLMPVSLFNKAYTELSKLHKEFLYHGDIKLDNFKVDLETGKVTLVNFMFCGDSFQGLFSVSQKILTAEKKKLFNLFADYMTEEEITNLTI